MERNGRDVAKEVAFFLKYGFEWKMQSSLPYQVSMFFGSWVSLAWFSVEAFLLAHKKLNMDLPYHLSGVYLPECLLLAFLAPLELSRLALGKRGNLTVRPGAVVVSLALTLPWVLGVAYFMFWQAFVLRVESILGAVELGFSGAQFLLGIAAVISFNQSSAV